MQRLLPYFSFQGRANRQRFWVTTLTIFVFYFIGALIFGALARIPIVGIFARLVLIAVVLAALVAVLANSARRLHDRGKSAWWMLLFQGVPIIFGFLGAAAAAGGGGAGASGLFALLSLPISIWAFVELGCLKGTAGPNKYGSDPLAPAMEEVFA
jgi:uncharacterized membrane protein YhaH (DUF805 family)